MVSEQGKPEVKTGIRILVAIVLAELLISAGFFIQKSQQSAQFEPPLPDLGKLDTETAAELLQLRERVQDSRPTTWRTLAEAFLGNGYYVAAEKCFRHAAQLNPDDVQAVYGLGFCLERVGRTADAIPVLERAARGGHAELKATCRYQIGRCYLRQENVAEAEQAFRAIPEFAPAAYQLARLMIRSDRAVEAIPVLDRHLLTFPNSLKLIQLRMRAAEAAGDMDLARELHDREQRAEYVLVLEYGQSYISMYAVRHGLAAILSKAMELRTDGGLDQRRRALGRALDIIRRHQFWNYRSVFLAAAHVELGLKNLPAVSSLIDEVRTYTQDGVDVLELEGLMLAEKGDLVTANQVWLRAIAMKPSASLHQLMAEANANDPEISRYHQGRQLYWESLAAFRVNQLEMALTGFKKYVQQVPESGSGWYYLGETHRALREFDKADSAYTKCLEIDSGHSRAMVAQRRLERHFRE